MPRSDKREEHMAAYRASRARAAELHVQILHRWENKGGPNDALKTAESVAEYLDEIATMAYHFTKATDA